MAPTTNNHAARLAALGVTAADITAQGFRFWHADTEWSAPGESAGKPDRYQWRVYRGLRLSAGSNLRNSRGGYERPDAPWSVACALVWGQFKHDEPGASLPTVADGARGMQADARAAAEAAADAFLATLAPALDGAA